MLMLITASEDGARIEFYADDAALMARFSMEDEEPPPGAWLTPEQAAEDCNYWPEGAAFLAEVRPMQMEAEQVAVSWKVTPR